MKLKVLYRLGMIIALTIVLNACATGKKQYDLAMQLSQAGKKKEAIAQLENDFFQKCVSPYIQQS